MSAGKTKLTYFTQKLDGKKPKIENPDEVLAFWQEAPPGRYRHDISRPRKAKSEKQLGAIFGLAIDRIIVAFNDAGWDTSYLLNLDKPTGNPVSTGLMKEYLYGVCGIRDDEGRLVRLSKMNTLQANEFLESICRFAVTQWNIYIPEPDKNYKKNLTDDKD